VNQEMLDLATMAIETAKRAGAAASRVGINSARNVEVSYRERKPETIKESSTRNLQITLYVDGRYSAQGTSDLRPEELKRFITDAVATTRLLAEDPFRSLPDPKYYAGRTERDLKLYDASYAKWKAADRHASAKAAEAAALDQGGAKLISVTARVQDGAEEDLTITSNGFQGFSKSTYYVTTSQVTMQDEGDRRPMGYDVAVSVNRHDLPRPETVGAGAVSRTQSLLGGRKIKTETLPIIVENRNASRILAGLLGAMSGRAVQQKQSFLADKQGQKIGSDVLTLIDDPLLVGGLGSRLYDGDGITATRRTMIEAGVLREFFVDWYYSRKLGWEPTTGGASNLIIPPGKRSVQAIMKDLGRGIWITDFIGGNNNTTTGDASVGILGQLFEGGVPVHAVAEMNIAGNALEFWPKLVEVADDPWPYSSQRLPSLVFRDVVVSGL
jgi:PmbA protein